MTADEHIAWLTKALQTEQRIESYDSATDSCVVWVREDAVKAERDACLAIAWERVRLEMEDSQEYITARSIADAIEARSKT
jgi:hypothetical protein